MRIGHAISEDERLSISGDKSLLQETVDRILPVVDEHDIFVVTGGNLQSKVVQGA